MARTPAYPSSVQGLDVGTDATLCSRKYSEGPHRMKATCLPLALLLMLAALPAARAQGPVHLYAAGSLTDAMTEMLAQSGLPPADRAAPVFGPSGVLRERIEAGARLPTCSPRRTWPSRGAWPTSAPAWRRGRA